jgi:hypothetical protein
MLLERGRARHTPRGASLKKLARSLLVLAICLLVTFLNALAVVRLSELVGLNATNTMLLSISSSVVVSVAVAYQLVKFI